MSDRFDRLVPELPQHAPHFGGVLVQSIGKVGLRLLGWKVKGTLPDTPKAVFSAAPHTSNWDFIIAMFSVMAIGVKISYLMKKEAFFWPFKGVFMALGGIPIDRKASDDTVTQIVNWYEKSERLWVVITPEGTRKRVDKWKTGFLRVAEGAMVPVILVAWDYPSKTMVIDQLWRPTGDHAKDAQSIQIYMRNKYAGRYPDKQ